MLLGIQLDGYMIDILDSGEKVRQAKQDLSIWDDKEDEIQKRLQKASEANSKVDMLRAKIALRDLERLREDRRIVRFHLFAQ